VPFLSLTIELPEETLESLRAEARAQGRDVADLVAARLNALYGVASDRPIAAQVLSAAETQLLDTINAAFPREKRHRYGALVAARQAETLTEVEHAELMEITNQIETWNARRWKAIADLARLRGRTLDEMAAELQIPSPGYDGEG